MNIRFMRLMGQSFYFSSKRLTFLTIQRVEAEGKLNKKLSVHHQFLGKQSQIARFDLYQVKSLSQTYRDGKYF
jgi:hypothetical protein